MLPHSVDSTSDHCFFISASHAAPQSHKCFHVTIFSTPVWGSGRPQTKLSPIALCSVLNLVNSYEIPYGRHWLRANAPIYTWALARSDGSRHDLPNFRDRTGQSPSPKQRRRYFPSAGAMIAATETRRSAPFDSPYHACTTARHCT